MGIAEVEGTFIDIGVLIARWGGFWSTMDMEERGMLGRTGSAERP